MDQTRNGNGGAQPPGVQPGSPAAAMAAHRAKLAEQCAAPPPIPVETGMEELPIHVTHWGDHGPVLLLVHGGVQGGIGGGPSSFSRQQALAGHGWQVRLVDRPGFGRSPSRGVDDMVADAVWISDMLGDGAHLLGHSWGGAEALLAAARRPNVVRSLILVEPALHPLLAGDETLHNNARFMDDAKHNASALLATTTPAEYAAVFAASLGASSSDPTAPNESAAQLQADPVLASRFGCALLQAKMAPPPMLMQAADMIKRARIPVLTISGGWSPTFDAISALAARLTGGDHEIVSSPNHFPQSANPGSFNRVVDRFLRAATR
jgi:pimeloyl-ACP methyl ester carboxylesterase